MTEHEAINKTCHRSMGSDRLERCEASDCMAWRWVIEPSIKDMREPTGYCGLAGPIKQTGEK
jgi:hypothetical protein